MFLPFKAVSQLKLKLKGNEKTNLCFSATWLAGSQLPDQGLNQCSLLWKGRVSTIGLPEKSQAHLFNCPLSICFPYSLDVFASGDTLPSSLENTRLIVLSFHLFHQIYQQYGTEE